ncbi:MAG: putative PeptidaseS8 domain-containing protein [Nitrospira sp.]|nr:MAG: putative PeptidaseS8 domain-containing protein [Nitrospira sp.]
MKQPQIKFFRGTLVLPLLATILSGCTQTMLYQGRPGTAPTTSKHTDSFLYAELSTAADTTTMALPGATTPSHELFRTQITDSSLIDPTRLQLPAIKKNGPKPTLVWTRRVIRSTSMKTIQDTTSSSSCAQPHTHPWDTAYEELLCHHTTARTTSTMPTLYAVEPELGSYDEVYVKKTEQRITQDDHLMTHQNPSVQASSSANTTIQESISPIWPSPPETQGNDLIAWHRGDAYTQLDSALTNVRQHQPATSDSDHIQTDYVVTAAHLDTGYFKGDRLVPKHQQFSDSYDCRSREVLTTGSEPTILEGCRLDDEHVNVPEGNTHGSRTLSVLAGQDAFINGTSRTISANPDLHVISFRISTALPVHFFPTEMAAAIATATKQQVDLISLSHGGFPSVALRETVNVAYDKGVPIFAATGDFFAAPPNFSLTPHTIAFPARFNRVMGVAGVTADGTTYGKDPCYWCLWRLWDWFTWSMRGSYGPAREMTGHTVVAYAPNITTSVSDQHNPNAIQMGGEGTSFSTPQVAGAAALWLQYHQTEFTSTEWRSWEKSEAVYQALMKSAKRTVSDYSCETMGEGVLQANHALSYNKARALEKVAKRERSTIGILWVYDLFNSWDLVKTVLKAQFSPLNLENVLTDQLQRSITTMLQTELEQVIHRSDAIARLLTPLLGPDCQPQETIPATITQSILTTLLQEDLSNTLRATLLAQEAQLVQTQRRNN